MRIFKESLALRYCLFSFSNFLAAFGGGVILGKGIGVIDNSFLHGSSVLAFLMGSVLGLAFIQFLPEQWSKKIVHWFSFFCGVTSLFLFAIFKNYALNGKIANLAAFFFFLLLIIRFGFWFYSRVSRAAEAAGQKQRIAWVEFGYFLGVILGLIIWEILGIEIRLGTALILDALLQFSAGFIDLFANYFFHSLMQTIKESQENICNNSSQTNSNSDNTKIWGWRLAIAVMFLTVGIQVITFNLSYQVSERFGVYILAFFYIGVSIAAIIYSKFKIRLEWHQSQYNYFGYAAICFEMQKQKKQISFVLICVLAVCCVVITAILQYRDNVENIQFMLNTREILILIFICAGALFYEILALSIIDRIGLEERFANNKIMVMRTYGVMAIGAAISLWIIGATKISFFGLFVILNICLVLTTQCVRKRYLTSILT